jgi:hypothetical protein
MKYATVLAAIGLVDAQGPPIPGPNHPHCSINVLTQGRCHDVYSAIDSELKRMGPGHPSPEGNVDNIFRELPDKDIWGYKTHESKTGDVWIDDFKFEFIDLGHGNDHECTVHGFSMTQNVTHYDDNANFCNLFNVFTESGVRFADPTADDCKFMPKDVRECMATQRSHPHCELSALYEHDCHTAFEAFEKDIKESHPGPDGKDYVIKRETPDRSITGYNTKDYGNKTHSEVFIDAFRFEFIHLGEDNDPKCAVNGMSESYNATVYDHDANFCNLYNVFNGTGLNFSDPVLSDCLYRPRDIRTCKFFDKEPKKANGQLSFIQ